MNYKNYPHSIDSAWKILIECRVTALPVRVTAICNQLGIHLRALPEDDFRDGVCTAIGGEPYIGINPFRTPERQRFTVAHEMGHLILGHVGVYHLINREPSPADNPIERAANAFASRLLAPSCVLRGCGVRCADDIRRLCGISPQAAMYRMERMHDLTRREITFSSSLERQVYSQFRDFICQHQMPADSGLRPLPPR